MTDEEFEEAQKEHELQKGIKTGKASILKGGTSIDFKEIKNWAEAKKKQKASDKRKAEIKPHRYESGGKIPTSNAKERSVQSYEIGGPIDNMNPVNPNEMRNPMNPPNPNQMEKPMNMAGPKQNNDSLMGGTESGGYAWIEDLVPREMADGRFKKGGKVKKK